MACRGQLVSDLFREPTMSQTVEAGIPTSTTLGTCSVLRRRPTSATAGLQLEIAGRGTAGGGESRGSAPEPGGCPKCAAGPDVSSERHCRGASREENVMKYMILT